MRVCDGMKCYGSRISPRMWIDSNGQLVCVGAIIARTGSYDYLESEIKSGGDPNLVVKVFRTPEEVFDPVAMASFENKPFCDDHPEDDVTLKNYKNLQKGFMRNIRQGEGDLKDCLLADIVVTDEDTINEIRRGDKRELSLGYDTNLEQDDSGQWVMKNIRGNHLALVDSGRAGCATIRDSASKIKNSIGGTSMKLFGKAGQVAHHRLYDEDIIKVEELSEDDDNDIELEELPVDEPKTSEMPGAPEDVIDEDPKVAGDDEHDKPLWDAIHALEARLDEFIKTFKPQGESEQSMDNLEDDLDDIPEDELESDGEEPGADLDLEEDMPDEGLDEDEDTDELLDADEVDVQNALEEPIRDGKRARDTKSVYSRFTGLNDRKSTKLMDSEQVQLIWQSRYDNACKNNR